MQFTIRHPLAEIRADLRSVVKHIRFGQAVALTRTAQDGRDAEVAEIDRAIDRPTPYTRNAVYVTRATPARPEASFGLKDDFVQRAPGTPPVNFLGPNIEGGQRRLKGMESILQAAGLMPKGYRAVPGPEARLDAYGNVSRGQVIQVLSQLRLTATAGYTRNLPLRQYNAGGAKLTKEQKAINAARQRAFVRAGGRLFVVKKGESKITPGIYSREVLGKKAQGPLRRPRAVFLFVARASYRRRLDWEQVAERTVAERLDYHMGVEIDKALATAR